MTPAEDSNDVEGIPSLPEPSPAITDGELRMKYVDDMGLSECIDLKQTLHNSEVVFGPREYHDRHGWELLEKDSVLNQRMKEIEEYVRRHDLRINHAKSFCLPFIFSRKYDFKPVVKLNGEALNVEYKTKFLGVHINSNGRWNDHIEYITTKARQRSYMILRLKKLGATDKTLKDIYILFIRSILEFAAPVWSGAVSVNKKLCKSLESVQRYVCRLIKPGADPEHTRVELGLDLLVDRRLNLCRKYGRQISKDPWFSEYFPRNYRVPSHSFGKVKIPSWKTQRKENKSCYLS